jgi:uncharacterized membrane protein
MSVAIGIVAGTWISAAVAHQTLAERLPDRVPIHWNINWEADGFVSRDSTFTIFYLMPALMTGVLALLCVLPAVSPERFKVDSFRPVYDYIVALVTGLFAYLYAVILHAQATGTAPGAWFIGGLFLFFGLMGNVLGKVRKNFWVGVRTPWTLASDVVWEKTHRLAAWTFAGAGVVGFLLVLVGVHPLVGLPLIIAAALIPIVYSLVEYKRLEKAGRLDVA